MLLKNRQIEADNDVDSALGDDDAYEQIPSATCALCRTELMLIKSV